MAPGLRHALRSILRLALAVFALGCTNGSTLIVELRTEMRPGVEFERVETALYAGVGIAALDLPQQVAAPVTFTETVDAYGGARVAELGDVPLGDYLVRVQLLDARRAVVGTGLATVVVEGASQVIVVLVNRACRGVQCPGSGRPNEIACLGGRCVDPACPEDRSACPPPDCALDSDCAEPSLSCGRSRCLEGFCVTVTDDSLCERGMCQIESGCVGVYMPPDAGGSDAGPPSPDAGVPLDAGSPDSGPPDSGPSDAGPPDAGPPDAGPPDSGPPPGPPCFALRTSGSNISLSGVSGSSPTWTAQDTATCAAPTGATPYYDDFVLCNEAGTPRSFAVEIKSHPSLPDVPDGSLWGYRGSEVPSDLTSCVWAVTGIGATTPSVTLLPGEYFVLRTGGTATGATGQFAMTIRP